MLDCDIYMLVLFFKSLQGKIGYVQIQIFIIKCLQSHDKDIVALIIVDAPTI